MDEALKLLHELNLHITTVNLDMGGNNRYALTAKAHPVISRIKLYLSDHPNKPVEPTAGAENECEIKKCNRSANIIAEWTDGTPVRVCEQCRDHYIDTGEIAWYQYADNQLQTRNRS